LELSLTHCEQLALFAVALTAVGIDLEALSHLDADDLPELCETTLAPAELSRLLAMPAEDQPRLWLSTWVRKEAVLKAKGKGLADGSLTELDVSAGWVDGLTLVGLDIGPAYLAAVAITPPAEEIILRPWIDQPG
jgi:4'-phosphopantetheinyl transferase